MGFPLAIDRRPASVGAALLRQCHEQKKCASVMGTASVVRACLCSKGMACAHVGPGPCGLAKRQGLHPTSDVPVASSLACIYQEAHVRGYSTLEAPSRRWCHQGRLHDCTQALASCACGCKHVDTEACIHTCILFWEEPSLLSPFYTTP